MLLSGLIHISGFFTNWKYDLYAGLFLTIPAVIWFLVEFVRNRMSFSTKNDATIDSRRFNWQILIQVPALIILIYLFIADFQDKPNSIILTLTIYFCIRILFEYRKTIIITDRFIFVNNTRVNKDSINSIDFRQDKIILVRRNETLQHIEIPLAQFDVKNKSLLTTRLMEKENGSQQ